MEQESKPLTKWQKTQSYARRNEKTLWRGFLTTVLGFLTTIIVTYMTNRQEKETGSEEINKQILVELKEINSKLDLQKSFGWNLSHTLKDYRDQGVESRQEILNEIHRLNDYVHERH